MRTTKRPRKYGGSNMAEAVEYFTLRCRYNGPLTSSEFLALFPNLSPGNISELSGIVRRDEVGNLVPRSEPVW